MDIRFGLLFLLPFIGGILAMMIGSVDKTLLKLFLAFSGAFLFSITVIDILPSIYTGRNGSITGLFILAGFFFQILLESFTKGIEHGHLHHIQSRYQLPLTIILGLCIHSFIEGIPMSNASILSNSQRSNLIYGVALHEAPAAFTLITLLRYNKISSFTTYIVLFLYSCMSLLGLMSGNLLADFSFISPAMLLNILALVVGTFLHISTTILFENSENHSFSRLKMVAIIAGVGLALLI